MLLDSISLLKTIWQIIRWVYVNPVRFRFLFDLSDFNTLHNDTDEIIVLYILSLDIIW